MKVNDIGTHIVYFSHNGFYYRCLRSTKMKIAQVGLKSFPSLDWTDYVQTGVKWERDECKHKYTSERPQVWKK